MSLICSILGHKYGDETVEERREERNGKTATIEISKKECLRCQKVKEDRRNASITNSDNGTNSVDTEEQTIQKTQESSTKDNTDNDAIFESAGYTNRDKDIIEGEADGGVILETDNDNKSNIGQTTSVDDLRSESNNERTSEDDEGVFRLSDDDNTDNSQTTEYRIICESCTFSSVETETSRRDGDLCPKCGSWLEVKELKDTDTSEV
jgi:hypothetical protein